MKVSFAFILFILSNFTFAKKLEVGDILLQPLSCSACSLIEEEEDSIFSHVGIVVAVDPDVKIAEAYGQVREVSLNEFEHKTQKDQKIKILRIRSEKAQKHLKKYKKDFLLFFRSEFLGRSYDHDFLWNNRDQNGQEKFYCSELISKLYLWFMGFETPIKKMHFEKNRDEWIKYFKGNPPDNKWGNSPGDFERSDLFYEVENEN